ncbi:MAG TPA: glycosyltransferase family 2 protein [Gaiellaceae bacterium]|nr:glycosyltransferase family 2 protein [Gaiellaceae bacterium]
MAAQLLDGLSILMPVYNEIERIERALDATLAVNLPCPFELVIVDDGSTDGTVEYLRNRSFPDNVRVHFHARNQGKGAAVRTALTDARLRFSAIFDADLEYDPDDLAVLVEPLRSVDGVNVVYGVRTFDGYTSHSFLFVMGNKSVTLAANVLFNVYIHDLMTCHKAMHTELFRSLPLRTNGFSIEPEITARLLQRGERIYEVPVSYRARASDEGKKLTATDGFRVLWTLLRCRLTSG